MTWLSVCIRACASGEAASSGSSSSGPPSCGHVADTRVRTQSRGNKRAIGESGLAEAKGTEQREGGAPGTGCAEKERSGGWWAGWVVGRRVGWVAHPPPLLHSPRL